VAALASDFYVFFAGVFAGLSAVFLAGLDLALTWDVSALFVFFRPHFFSPLVLILRLIFSARLSCSLASLASKSPKPFFNYSILLMQSGLHEGHLAADQKSEHFVSVFGQRT
jgi:hypothetical protein